MRPLAILAAIALALALAPAASAAQFDLVHPNRIDLTLCTNGCGITLGYGMGILVNKGTSDIDAAEAFGARFAVTSSRPDFVMYGFANNPGYPAVAPIHPGEAIGFQSGCCNSDMCMQLLQPGESFRNLYPGAYLGFQVSRVSGEYEGPVQFDVTLTIGAETAHFVISADAHVGPHDLAFVSAARTTSTALPTAASHRSWGALKSLYR